MRRSGLAAITVAGVLLATGCSDDAGTSPAPSTSGSGPAGPSSTLSPGAVATTEPPGPVPSVAGTPTPSETIAVAGPDIITHVYVPIACGVEWLHFEGQWYRTRDPIKNPPEGWTKPTQDGDVRIISKTHLRYEPYGLPDVVDFYRTKKTPPPCEE